MKNRIFLIIFLLFTKLIANGNYCIEVQLNKNTPISTNLKTAYIGCFKTKSYAKKQLSYLKQHTSFKNYKIVKKSSNNFIIFPEFNNKTDNLLYSQTYKYSKKFPTKIDGKGISILPLNKLSFLPISLLYKYSQYYKQHNFKQTILVLYKGNYSIEYLYKKLKNNNIIKKLTHNKYLITIPIYISPTASLTIKNKTILLSTTPKPIFILYNGGLFIKNTKIISWNTKTQKHSQRDDNYKNLRSYLCGMGNSNTLILNSTIKGLGFYYSDKTSGISIIKLANSNNIINNFLNQKAPLATFIGNNFSNLLTINIKNTKNTVLVGNIINKNIINDLTLHNNQNILVSNNIFTNTLKAQGIYLSNNINSFIYNNIISHNHSNGIVLNKNSNQNIVDNNFIFNNGFNGVFISQSNHNIIKNNTISTNFINGITIRNSIDIKIDNNFIYHNGKNGIELFTKQLKTNYPYYKATAVVVKNNNIDTNIFNQISVKNSSIKLINNNFNKENFNLFSNDLQPFLYKILKQNNFTLYSIGTPFKTDDTTKLKNTYSHIFIDLSKYNKASGLALADIYKSFNMLSLYKKELKVEASKLITDAINKYAFSLYKINETNKTKLRNITSYLVESTILGNDSATKALVQLKYILHINKNDINQAYLIAKKRMYKGMIFDNQTICPPSKQTKQYIKSAIYSFEYKLKYNNIKEFYDYLLIKNKNYNPFKNIKNIPIIIDNQQSNNIVTSTNKRYLAKKEFLNKQTKAILKTYIKKDIKKFTPILEKYLKKINHYRKSKLDINSIKALIKDSNE